MKTPEFTDVRRPEFDVNGVRAIWRLSFSNYHVKDCYGFPHEYVGNYTYIFDNGYVCQLQFPYEVETLYLGKWEKDGTIRYVPYEDGFCAGSDEVIKTTLQQVKDGKFVFPFLRNS